MDPSMPMILPKGFVVNSDEIYQEVAKYPVLPPEKTREYWLVYNTTFRELQDPTARRLENFWWRVWGSDRKELSGKVLARRFEDISTRPPFVHIPGPPNRWEPPPEVINLLQMLQKHAAEQERVQNENRKAKQKGSASKSSDTSVKTLASSASKPPPPHPILKKARGDSKSGPRPTARFVSPHETSDEAERAGEGTSSGSPPGKGLGIRKSTETPPKSEKKKSSTPTKKFHASSSSSKRRPGLARRPSSQSSTSSDVTPKEGPSSAGSRHLGSQRTVAPIAEQADVESSQLQQAAGAAPPWQRSAQSAKAAGKQPATRSPISKKLPPQSLAQPSGQGSESTAEMTQDARTEASRPSTTRPASDETIPPTKAKLPRVQSSDLTRKSALASSEMTRSRSHVDARRPREVSFGRSMPQGLTSTATTTSTTTDSAAGTIIGFDHPPAAPAGSSSDEERPELVRRPSATSLLDSRFVPTQPSAAPTLPLGRTKSQLTLLLEKENERKGGRSSKS